MKTKSFLIQKLLSGLLLMFSAQAAYSVTLSYNFTDLNSHIFPGSIASPGPGQTVIVDLLLTNNTGSTWTDFHFGTASPIGGTVFFGNLLGTATGYTGPGNASFGTTRAALDVLGLNILNGVVYASSVQLVFGEAPIALIAGNPTTNGGTPPPRVPEPAILTLMGLGLAGIGFRQQRRDRGL